MAHLFFFGNVISKKFIFFSLAFIYFSKYFTKFIFTNHKFSFFKTRSETLQEFIYIDFGEQFGKNHTKNIAFFICFA
jgi:hypothetical protein